MAKWQILGVVAALLFSGALKANQIRYKPVSLAVQKEDRLQIKGFAGRVQLVAVPEAQTVTVEVVQKNPQNYSSLARSLYEEWHFSFQRKDSQIVVQVQSPSSKKDWIQLLAKGEFPEFDLVIKAPSLPLHVSWHKGFVSLGQWENSAAVNLHEGEFQAQGGEGRLSVHVRAGQVKVEGRQGSLSVDSYDVGLIVKDHKGSVRVENHNGGSLLTNIDGDLDIVSFKGTTRIQDSQGRLNFKNGRAPFKIEKFNGAVRGRSREGSVQAYLVGETDVRIRSESGEVSVRAPRSGAWGNFGSEEGTLYVPSYLKLTRLPNIKVRQGRLRGSQNGKIFVRTETGDIRFR